MMQCDQNNSTARFEAESTASRLRRRWLCLTESFLPVTSEYSIWRYSRESQPGEPTQGWKLHISATILEACSLFERVAPFLSSQNVIFKAPNSLDVLAKINCGLQFGYWQVGKFITVYPSTEKQAVRIARKLHLLTRDFVSITIPFDEPLLSDSSVFYRYGAFSAIEAAGENGRKFLAIKNASGETVPDDRFQAVPEWLADPFRKGKKLKERTFAGTPLGTTYRIFRAITQRGKGGTYLSIDLSQDKPRLCVIKEGQRCGELGWNGQDGHALVRNEFEVLSVLKKKYAAVPAVFDSFEVYGNFFFAMEYVEGSSLQEMMRPRRRRFSIREVLRLAVEIAGIIEKIHEAGWIWNDCKPANLIVTNNKTLRPVDFESAYRAGKSEPFDWKTKGFSSSSGAGGEAADIFALGAVIYFLLTGKFYDEENPAAIGKLRRNVPKELVEITEGLLSEKVTDLSAARQEFDKMLKRISA